MLGISGTELVIILFFGFLILGPEKLPQMGRTVGRAIRQFRDATETANKKFKEEVADPFQEAMAPYKDQMEDVTKPLQEDINAINDTFNETKSMVTDPFKDMFKPSKDEEKGETAKTGTVIAGGTASDKKPESETAVSEQAPAASDDPFAGVFDDEVDSEEQKKPAGEAKPIPELGGSVKKSLAASLYDLDDEEGGE